MTPRLSVITACYNHGRFVAESIKSVMRQTEENIELVVVDDGSTDNSRDEIWYQAVNNDRMQFFANEKNLGLAASQNIGIRAARAPWVLKVDADDWISESYVAEILEAARVDPARNVIFSPAHLFGSEDRVYRYPEFDAARMRAELFIPGPAAFRRTLWTAVGGYDESMRSAEDWDLYIRAHLITGLTPYQIPTPLWHYRQHDGVRASAHGMARLRYLQAYWQGHTRESVLNRSRSWGQWCAERKVAA